MVTSSRQNSGSGGWEPIDLLFVLGISMLFSLVFAWAYAAESGTPSIFDHLPAWLPDLLGSKGIGWLLGTGGVFGGAGLVLLRKWLFKEHLPTIALVMTLVLTAGISAALIVLPSMGAPKIPYADLGVKTQINIETDNSTTQAQPGATAAAIMKLHRVKPNPIDGWEDLTQAGTPPHYTYSDVLLGSDRSILHYINRAPDEGHKEDNVHHDYLISGAYTLSPPSQSGVTAAEITLKCPTVQTDDTAECQPIECKGIDFEGCPGKASSLAKPGDPFSIETVAYAKSSIDPGRGPGWVVPSLQTLQAKPANVRPGYTKFDFGFKPGASVSKADRYYIAINANGENIFIDGSYPEETTFALKPNDWNAYSFGLENLDFAGGDDGTEKIGIAVTFLSKGQPVATEKLTLPYIALRDVPPVSAHGQNFDYQWSGKYLVADSEDIYEIFTGSSTNMQANKDARDAFDRQLLTINPGNGVKYRAVMKLRPPLTEKNNPNYGTALGYLMPNGQLKFTFSAAESSTLCGWAASNLKASKVQVGVYNQKTRAEVPCDKWPAH